jgi:RNA polymerase sigma-70 factor (ECF subfamily)
MSAPSSSIRVHSDDRERDLLRRTAARDRQAFEELYTVYHRRLTRFLMRLAPRYELAEEVINDTFWVVWQKAGDFRGASRVSTWIMGIAYRCALKVLRGERSVMNSELSAMQEALTEEPTRTEEDHDWLMQGLRQLPLEQRMTLELAYFLGHSCEEIGAIMNCPATTVKTRMFHAREKLRVLLPLGE